MLHDGKPYEYDPVQGQGQDHGGRKVAKVANFRVCPSASMYVIKSLMVNHDSPRTYLNFNWTDF